MAVFAHGLFEKTDSDVVSIFSVLDLVNFEASHRSIEKNFEIKPFPQNSNDAFGVYDLAIFLKFDYLPLSSKFVSHRTTLWEWKRLRWVVCEKNNRFKNQQWKMLKTPKSRILWKSIKFFCFFHFFHVTFIVFPREWYKMEIFISEWNRAFSSGFVQRRNFSRLSIRSCGNVYMGSWNTGCRTIVDNDGNLRRSVRDGRILESSMGSVETSFVHSNDCNCSNLPRCHSRRYGTSQWNEWHSQCRYEPSIAFCYTSGHRLYQ